MSQLWTGLGYAGIAALLLVSTADRASHAALNKPRQESVLQNQIAQCDCRRSGTDNPRGPQDPLIPYVLYPRDTRVLSDRPSLMWNMPFDADEFTRYTVSVLNGTEVVWTKIVTENAIAYPDDVPGLQPGIDYTLLVEASTGLSSSEDEWAYQTFQLLPTDQTEAVQQAIALLDTQPDLRLQGLLKANLYEGFGLYGEAIATLKSLIDNGVTSATVLRELGSLYERSGLDSLAERQYLDAIDRAADDVEELALTQSALGNLYAQMEEIQEAERWFNAAKESYILLNNQYQILEIEEILRELDVSL